MLANLARRALARPCVVSASQVPVARRFSAEVEGEDGEKPSEVAIFMNAIGIEGHDEKFADLKALLHDTKTEKLKEFGMSVQQRKKLLSHVEKYKRGLWAPKELRR